MIFLKKKKITIIGHFGGKNQFFDGQTVKSKILYDELEKSNRVNIKIVDTYYKKRNVIKFLFLFIKNTLFTKHIIVLLSSNGRKALFPYLYIMSKYFHKKVYHDVIGGFFDKQIKDKKKMIKYVKSFDINWVETKSLMNRLNLLDVYNVDVLPNFKQLKIVDLEKNVSNDFEEFHFCTFSRVVKEKGISDAINAINKVNLKGYKCYLDIYGPIDDKYKEEFDKLLEMNKKNISYCGIVPYDKSTDVLVKYDLLLFPTYWEGEGFPGTIVDAFSSGLPVIATDWNCNSEIVSNYVTGIVYPNKNEKTLDESIIKVITNTELYKKMKLNTLNEARKYMPDEYIKIILERIYSK